MRLAAVPFLLGLAAPAVAAGVQPEYPGLVPAFLKVCAEGDLTPAAREAAFAAEGWQEEPATLNVAKLGETPSIDRNFDWSSPVSVRQWRRDIDGAQVRAVLATFPEKRRYPTICAVAVPGVRYGWPYDDAFKAGVKALGLKGKSTDLPHYFEYSGKIGGTRPVRAELFGRSSATSAPNTLHLYLAF